MASLPSLRQLSYFVALAKDLNFTRAAQASFVGQSTLSTGLKELEDSLGVRLVERDRQNVSITPIGLEILERAKVILAASEDLVEFSKASGKPMSGTIRLGVIPTIAPFLLPNVLPDIRERFPDLQIALREDLTANLLARLAEHQLDFALIALPFETEGLLVSELFNDEFCLVAREGDPALKSKEIQLPAKLAERLLLLEEGHCLREHTMQACRQSDFRKADGMEATSLLTLLQMVESGMGIALLPEMALKGGLLNGTHLVARPLAPPVPKRIIALVARSSTAHLEEFNALSLCIQEQFKGANKSSRGLRKDARI
ncbi:LysR family transcriptional regulator, hydrogen peroxide-inducible genes activator [Polynucleobacter meluiroseus]|uniref:LysR family transcriptional regulator, hydrogen peroxide-inducible genes activator n=1 Tax=Polynucleobacter meluiroseus TaxID=1938814 RepID=A0A240E1Y5_9BURK|nr:hydrogen peroxide-inducible genes activator [Polynucleobacter meluiroseus]SNX29448.1 LysR family transcriptional regulator, hydrogen peroxide-inducible genes activator [Polynucleobacter meluiroseus]